MVLLETYIDWFIYYIFVQKLFKIFLILSINADDQVSLIDQSH